MLAPFSSIGIYSDDGKRYVSVSDTLASFTLNPEEFLPRVQVPTFRLGGIQYASFTDMAKQVGRFFGNDEKRRFLEWDGKKEDRPRRLTKRKLNFEEIQKDFENWAIKRKQREKEDDDGEDALEMLIDDREEKEEEIMPVGNDTPPIPIDPSVLAALLPHYISGSEMRARLDAAIHNVLVQSQPALITVADRLDARNIKVHDNHRVSTIGKLAATYYRKKYHRQPLRKAVHVDGTYKSVNAYTLQDIDLVDKAIDDETDL